MSNYVWSFHSFEKDHHILQMFVNCFGLDIDVEMDFVGTAQLYYTLKYKEQFSSQYRKNMGKQG